MITGVHSRRLPGTDGWLCATPGSRLREPLPPDTFLYRRRRAIADEDLVVWDVSPSFTT
jgi:hypothetical protein